MSSTPGSASRTTRRVAVVGGGLAGITTALGLADAGAEVVLVESRARLGGLTNSFDRDGLWVDNGQHVFLRCCTAYRGLLARLGVSDLVHLQDRLDVPVKSGIRPGLARLQASTLPLPAPWHLAGSLARYRWLGWADRVRAGRGALALRDLDRDDPAADDATFGWWLREHGQDDRTIAALWDLVGVATLNAHADQASLALAATVFQLGLLQEPDAADIGWSAVPLQRLHGDAAERALAEAGVEVLCSTRVHDLEVRPHGVEIGPGIDGLFDDVVLATPPTMTERLLPPGASTLATGWSTRLGTSPIVNLHLVLDRPILHQPFVAAVDNPLQWVFDRTQASGMDASRGQYLACSISAADELIGMPVASIQDWMLPHLADLLPQFRTVRTEQFFVTREPEATFRPTPGSARWRPGARTRAPRVHLAGAWTATGWPATMESACRSGQAAVHSVLTAARPQEIPSQDWEPVPPSVTALPDRYVPGSPA
ncbi:MAG: hydroxysqualene dehydroxylase HpnE [Marmoricola sp.]